MHIRGAILLLVIGLACIVRSTVNPQCALSAIISRIPDPENLSQTSSKHASTQANLQTGHDPRSNRHGLIAYDLQNTALHSASMCDPTEACDIVKSKSDSSLIPISRFDLITQLQSTQASQANNQATPDLDLTPDPNLESALLSHRIDAITNEDGHTLTQMFPKITENCKEITETCKEYLFAGCHRHQSTAAICSAGEVQFKSGDCTRKYGYSCSSGKLIQDPTYPLIPACEQHCGCFDLGDLGRQGCEIEVGQILDVLEYVHLHDPESRGLSQSHPQQEYGNGLASVEEKPN